MEEYVGLLNYWVVIFLMMTGFYIVIGQRNLIKSIIGLNIFQTSVFLMYITMGKVSGGTAPIIPPERFEAMNHGGHGHGSDLHADHATPHTHAAEHADHAAEHAEHAAEHAAEITNAGATVDPGADGDLIADELIYSNPLPSVLMLTAIVVGIATTALALALIVRIREDYGTIEEDEILELDLADAKRERAESLRRRDEDFASRAAAS
ncbi:MAG: cation:proton antiporter subunit C [Planctomycetota bacterium]